MWVWNQRNTKERVSLSCRGSFVLKLKLNLDKRKIKLNILRNFGILLPERHHHSKKKKKKKKKTGQNEEESVKQKMEYEALCKQFEEIMESYKKKMEQASVKQEDTKSPKEGNVSLVDVKTALRRDFKIMGVIGGEEQKDRLSFVSLIRQIDAGRKKGYKGREIIDAVIRAISPSLKLRSYLETKKYTDKMTQNKMYIINYILWESEKIFFCQLIRKTRITS